MTTGQLADGEYKFELNVYSGATQSDLSLSDSRSKTIFVESTSGINLESPGGELADTSFNLVYSTYPIFNWIRDYAVIVKRISEWQNSKRDIILRRKRQWVMNVCCHSTNRNPG